uniref:Uncharacterized protein n=1 Tax=Oryza brachyantha TaxID=4533 RepID=J3LQ90_ORYBR
KHTDWLGHRLGWGTPLIVLCRSKQKEGRGHPTFISQLHFPFAIRTFYVKAVAISFSSPNSVRPLCTASNPTLHAASRIYLNLNSLSIVPILLLTKVDL